MSDSIKLFFAAGIVSVAGFLKGIAPTTINQPFDIISFSVLGVISLIIIILGFIKLKKGE